MNRKTIGLAAAASALMAVPGGAAATPALAVQSYAELLTPIDDAREQLRLDNLRQPEAPPVLIPARYHDHRHGHSYHRPRPHGGRDHHSHDTHHGRTSTGPGPYGGRNGNHHTHHGRTMGGPGGTGGRPPGGERG
jgi:hypothetical protein